MDFQGNPLFGGNAANGTGMPALADIDQNGRLDAAFVVGLIQGTNYPDPRSWGNPNAVYILTDQTGTGGYALQPPPQNKPGFPQPLRDGASGVTVADLVPPLPNQTNTLEVIASNFQDAFKLDGTRWAELVSRPYVWQSNGLGLSPFAHSDLPDSLIGQGLGHTNAAVSAFDVDGNGRKEMFFPTLGRWYSGSGGTFYGSIVRLEATRDPVTQAVSVSTRTISSENADGYWLTFGGKDQSQFQAAPTMVRTDATDPDSERIVAAAAYSGDIYAWGSDGTRQMAVQTDEITGRGHVVVDVPVVAADVYDDATIATDDDRSEIVVTTGRGLHYNDLDCELDPAAARFWDGYIYCYWKDADDTWQRAWRYPATDILDDQERYGGYPAFASGASVGRLMGPNTPPCIVSVDASGRVVALRGDLPDSAPDSERELWTFKMPKAWPAPAPPNYKSVHRYTHGSVTQPLILDVNGDNYQDVIVGTTSGWVYVLDGRPDATTRVLRAEHTFRSADSTTKEGVVEPQYEEVRGIAVGSLNHGDSSRAILVVVSGRPAYVAPYQVGGHVILFDLGPNSWREDRHDWPQYQQNAERTGHYPGP